MKLESKYYYLINAFTEPNFSILPGVGSYKTAMKKIREKKIDEAIYNLLKKGN